MRRYLAIALILLLSGAASLAEPRTAAAAGALVRAGGSAVYYRVSDGRRYGFPNAKTYASWYADFSDVTQVSEVELAASPLAGTVTYRPGVRMLKIQTDPKVYAVAAGGTLRWVISEEVAQALYGPQWSSSIDDVPDAFFAAYRIGEPIDSPDEYSPSAATAAAFSIEEDLGIAVDDETAAWRAFAFNDLNAIRAAHGRSPLVLNPLLSRIAQIHSEDMGSGLGLTHDGSLGETADERMRFGKVPDLANDTFMYVPHPEDIGWTGENVGYTTMRLGLGVEDGISRLHQAFMDEPVDEENHRTTMLSTLHPYSEVGIGIHVDENGTLWLTEDFISIR